jgi:hypothetical protein
MQPGAHESGGEKVALNDRVGRGERNGLARQQSSEWLGRGTDGLIGLSDVNGLGSRRKSFADALQVQKTFHHCFFNFILLLYLHLQRKQTFEFCPLNISLLTVGWGACMKLVDYSYFF